MYEIKPFKRFFALWKGTELICICVFRKGAENVKRILEAFETKEAA